MSTSFERVSRPKKSDLRSGLAAALRETLASGDALAFPINGETYAVVRNRKAASAYQVAVKLNAAVRSAHSDDGRSVLIWLEPK